MNATQIGVVGVEELKVQQEEIREKIQTLFALLRQTVTHHEYDKAERLFDELLSWVRLGQTIDEVSGRLAAQTNDTPNYFFGSSLLCDAYAKLGSIQTESILYVAGYRFGNAFVASELVPLELEQSSIGYASGEIKSVAKSLIQMEQDGSVLCAHLHMHPGKGASSTYPSGIDTATQRRFESGGLLAVGGIFSRDGYLRFFTEKLQFNIIIAGKGVTRVGANLFKLSQDK